MYQLERVMEKKTVFEKIVLFFNFISPIPALCEQFTHRSGDDMGLFPAVAFTSHWVPEVLYSRATKPWEPTSPDCQPSNAATLISIYFLSLQQFAVSLSIFFFYLFHQL